MGSRRTRREAVALHAAEGEDRPSERKERAREERASEARLLQEFNL
jgi:hypothetical protein